MARFGRGCIGRAWIVAAVLVAAGTMARADEARESWDAIYVGAEKIGHNHIKVAPVKDSNGRKLVRVQVNSVVTFKRGRDRVNMEIRYGTIETTEGAVLRLDTRTKLGDKEMRTFGDVIDGAMNLTVEVEGKRQETPVAWADDVRGPYAAELSLSHAKLAPGQTRDVKTYIPDLNKICVTHLKAFSLENVALGGGVTRSLFRVEQTVTGPDGKPMPELDTTHWVDESGQILKSRASLLGGTELYRTTRQAALAPNGDFDLLAATIIKVVNPIANSEQTRNIVYHINCQGADAAEVFPNDQRQSSSPPNTDGTIALEVRTDSPTTGEAVSTPAAEEFTRANPLVNSEDPRVVAHAKAAIGRRTDPWEKASAIQAWVFQNMKKKNFGNAFAPAAEVARNLEGDCTEHGVLTAAMCRAAGVPCRVVVGFVYARNLNGFGPHMWNEVFVDGRWVAIDATFNQSAVDATHLKLATSSLDGVAPFEAMMPVLRVFNRLKIDVAEIR